MANRHGASLPACAGACWIDGDVAGQRLVLSLAAGQVGVRRWLAACAAAGLLLWPQLARPQAQVLVDDRGHRLTLAQPAQRVVSLLPSLTETVCALGACQRLVGVDRFSNWPAALRGLPKLGGLEDTQIERIVSLKPDLVLVAVSSRATDRLEALGLPVLALEPKSLAETRQVLRTLALALGRAEQGEQLWASLEARIQAAAARVPLALRGQRVYFEISSAPYAASEASFVGELLARLGLGNIVPAAMGPFPKLNPEFVLRAQPGLVMGAGRDLAEMPARPGWGALKALRQQRSCGFSQAQADMLMRPGPRLAEGAELIVECLLRIGGRSP